MRTLAAVSVASLCLTLTAACGSAIPPQPEPTAAPPAPTTTAAPSATVDPSPVRPAPSTAAPTTAAPTAEPSTITRQAPPRRRYHRGPGQPYRFENSERGLAFARARGYEWIDIDCNYARGRLSDGRWAPVVPIATHWDKIDTEGFDPQGRYTDGTRWRDLTWHQVRALRTADRPPYRILRMDEMVRAVARAGFTGMEWEVKTGPAFEDPRTYTAILALARRLGLTIEVKTLYALGGVEASYRRLRAAKLAGAFTMLIKPPGRPVVVPAAQQRYIDVVRGPWRRGA
ncbi:hypothetical protein [Nocardioides sp.]|uniref:hypothetical protein n=1 Tax=Nocardioides sp. TaxID=35761 RepID=UPI003515CD0B